MSGLSVKEVENSKELRVLSAIAGSAKETSRWGRDNNTINANRCLRGRIVLN
jgi:hypothetical protein